MATEDSPLLGSDHSDEGSPHTKKDRRPKNHQQITWEEPDDSLHLVGNPGVFHYFQVIALCLQFTPLLMSDLIPIFYNLPPEYVSCGFPGSDHFSPPGNYSFANSTMYCNCSGELSFSYKQQQSSIIGDMDLVCGRDPLPNLATTVYYVGSAVAGPIIGAITDHRGRRPVLLISSVVFTGIHVALIFVRNFYLFAFLRFLAGVGRVGIFSTAFVLLMEWTPPSRRTVVAAASEFFFPAGVILLAGSSWYLQRWENVQIFLAASTGIGVLNIWFAPESPQWLIVRRRTPEAVDIVRKISRLNGNTASDEQLTYLERISQNIDKNQNSGQSYTVLDCFRIPKIRKYTILISFVWFATNFGYSGLSFLIDKFSDSIYFDLMIGGALESAPCLLATLIALKSRKRLPMIGFFVTAGIVTLASGLVTTAKLRIVLALLGRMSLVGSYCLMFLYAAELFPTQIRNSGFGVGFFFFMVGGMLSPHLSSLAQYAFAGVPLVVIGAVSMLGAVAVAWLPENTDPSILHIS